MTQHTMDTQELDMAGLDVRPKHPQLFHIKEMADQAEIKKKSFQLGPSKHVTYADGINQSNIHDVINILELKLKSKPNLEHNSRIQDAVDKVIEQIRGKIHDTMPGKFKQVGSSRDGTRPGYLAEFDYIYQLEKDVFDIKQDKDDLLAYYLFEPEYVKSNASDIQREFRETIDGIFEEGKVILPQRMSHSGFAGPRFSGVRRNGPATALLLKWSEEDEEDLPFSIDLIVALGIPESMRDDLRDHVNNKLKPVFHDKDETSVFPFGVDNICFVPQSPDKSTWELSTSELEAKLVEKIDDKAPAKRVIKLEKLLAGEPVLTELSPYREEAIPHNVGEMLANVLNGYTSYAESHPQDAEAFRADLKKIMLYAHIFLGQEVAIGLGELSKSSVCLKSYAIKHATLMLAAEKPGSFEQAHNRVYKQLLADVLDEISEQARSRNGEVPHYFLPGRQIRIFSRAAYADDDAAGRTADQIRHNCEMMASKLQRKKGRPGTFDERHDNRIISGSRLQELKFECRKCYTTIFTIGELRKIQDLDGSAHFAVIGQAIMSKCRKDTNITNMNKTFGASFTKTGDLLCRSCNNDLGVLTQYEPLGYMPTDDLPVVKICSFLVTESSGKTHTFKQWKQVKFAIDVLSPDPDLISPEAQPS